MTTSGSARSAPAQPHKDTESALPQVSLAQYILHLRTLEGVVATCSAHHDTVACNPEFVGQDEQVQTATAIRRVHYDWLRDTLRGVAVMHVSANAAPDARKEWLEHLQAAGARLAEEEAAATAGPPTATTPDPNARRQLDSILKQSEFKRLRKPDSVLDSAQQRFWGWVFRGLVSLARAGGHLSWLGRILLAVLILAPFVLLFWWLLQPGRFDRRASPEREALDPLAPSAREWQQWLAEGEHFAREGRWREAVHHVYWAAISRMEARGLWVADRARTPREYLDLLSRQSVLLPDLRVLTRNFERIWYGNRPAQEREYRDACRLMERLEPK